jgi:hypothetical protein
LIHRCVNEAARMRFPKTRELATRSREENWLKWTKREVLATRIVDLAREGLRDRIQLRERVPPEARQASDRKP